MLSSFFAHISYSIMKGDKTMIIKHNEKDFLKWFRTGIIGQSIFCAIFGLLGLFGIPVIVGNIEKYNGHKKLIKQAREMDAQKNVHSEFEYFTDGPRLVEVKAIIKDLDGNVIEEFSSNDGEPK